MLEERVGRVVRAKGRAHGGNSDAAGLAIVVNKGNHLVAKISIKNFLNIAAMKRVRAFIVKTEPIYRIHGINFDSSAFNKIGKRRDHALVFQLPFVAGAGGKSDEWGAPMSVDYDSELHSKPRRMPAVHFSLHRSPFRYCRPRVCQRSRAGANSKTARMTACAYRMELQKKNASGVA